MATLNSYRVHRNYLFICWDYWTQRKSAVKELRALEETIREDRLKGWIAETDRENYPMRKILEKLGAKPYGFSGKKLEQIFYMKEVI